MADHYRTHGKYAGWAKADAARRGRQDGYRRYPSAGHRGDAAMTEVAEAATGATDTFAAGQAAENDVAAALAVSDHLGGRRPADDAAVNDDLAVTLRLIGEAAERRQDYGIAVHELAAFESRAPVAARTRFWPGWLRLLVILAMAACGGANLAAGLLSVTTDDPAYALTYAAAIGVALVGLGAATGHMLRRWELNAQRPREHVARGSRVPVLVVALGLLFAAGLVAAVASIRATGALAEAQRWAEGQGPLEFVLPDAAPDAPDAAGGAATGTPDDPPPTIPPLAWGVLEGVLVTGALLIEYAGALPWAARHAELQKRCRRRRTAWERRRAALARAVADLKTAWDARADRDAAVLVAGEATRRFTAVEVAAYRGENLATRAGEGGGPFAGRGADTMADGMGEPGGVLATVAERWGVDLRPLAARPRSGPAAPVPGADGLVAFALARGVAELAAEDVRPRIAPVTWDPAGLYDRELRGAHQDPAAPPAEARDGGEGHGREGDGPPWTRAVAQQPSASTPLAPGDDHRGGERGGERDDDGGGPSWAGVEAAESGDVFARWERATAASPGRTPAGRASSTAAGSPVGPRNGASPPGGRATALGPEAGS